MKANEVGLNSFLSQSKTQFVIPVYQRNYDWTETQCVQLLNDILQVGRRTGESHFIGSIVFIHDGVFTSSEVKKLVIIDGQQRLTTFSILYLALYRFALSRGWEERASEIRELYIFNKFVKDDGSKLKLKQSDLNAKAFNFLLSENDVSKYPGYSRVIENYQFFSDQITEENFEAIRQGINSLLFVEISLERGKDDPQRIFESLNSTGLELSQADLIRNYILMGLDPDEQVTVFDRYWEVIESNARDNEKEESRVSDFIRDYLTFKTKRIPNKNKVYDEFKARYPYRDDSFYSETLNELKAYSYHYSKLINPLKEHDPEIRRELQYIQRLEINISYPFLLPVIEDHRTEVLNKQDLVQILKLIQSYTWRRFVVNLPTAVLNKMFMTLYNEVNRADYRASIEKALVRKKGTLKFPTNEEVSVALLERDIYNAQAKNRTYFLELLENHENREFVSTDNPYITVEHIFPQNPDESWYSELPEEEFKEFSEKYLNTIANLTLSGNNGSLSNRSFEEKKNMDKDGRQQGYKFSRLWLNQFLKEIDEWNLERFKERYQLLLERFLDIWEYPEVDIDEESDTDEDFTIYNAPEPRNKKLDYFIFRDEKVQTEDVSKMYSHVIYTLYKENPNAFFHRDIQNLLGLTSQREDLRNAFQLSPAHYIETGLNNNTKFNKLKTLLPKFNAEEDLLINYSNSGTTREGAIDQTYWQRKCSDETWSLIQECEELLKEIDPEMALLYRVGYVGLQKAGAPRNLITFRPTPAFIRIVAKVRDANSFAGELDKRGIEFLSIGKRQGRLKFRLKRNAFVGNRQFLKEMFQDALQNISKFDGSDQLSNAKKFQLDFWTRFRDKLLETREISAVQTPRPQYWFDVTIGKTYVHLSAICNTSENIVGIKVYIGNKAADKIFPFLESRKEEIEQDIGQKLVWNPHPEKQDKIILLEYPSDLRDAQKVEDALDWLVKYTVKFRQIFSKLVQDL